MTVASAVESLEELNSVEVRHLCPEKALADLLVHEQEIEAHAQRN
jgi:hypothetical protein